MDMCGSSETINIRVSFFNHLSVSGHSFVFFFPNFSWVLLFHCIFNVLSQSSIWIILSKVYLQFSLPRVPAQVPACFPKCTQEYLNAFSSKQRFVFLLEITQRGNEKLESSSLVGETRDIRTRVILRFYICLCLYPQKLPGGYSMQNPQEEFGHTFQSSLVFNNPLSLKGKPP